ncbi:MAG: metallophosphoesterase family protein [Candidatus Woesearchaeota archaeon]|jgi:calcineurin-like phosphoesterase family protein|nr:metallophosphoesterase family protein [Candidatus Woesearchaeota archaeon]
MNFYISDYHLGHKNIIKFSSRPFANLDEMHKVIIENILKVMKRGDILYHIGDLSFNVSSQSWFFEELFKLGISLYMVEGNHEIVPNIIPTCLVTNKLKKMIEIKINNHPVTLCHYPMVSWNKSHYNAWLLYGHHHSHSHGSSLIQDKTQGKMLNVNCEFHDYTPWSEKEIIEYMETRPNNWDYIDRK